MYTLTQPERMAVSRILGAERGPTSQMHMTVDAQGMPVRMFSTAGTVADCSQAYRLIEE